MAMNLKSRKLIILSMLLANFLQILCNACVEEERHALLELRAFSNIPDVLPWKKEGRDCCAWSRVRFNNTTRRITHLNLHSLNNIDQGPLWDLNFNIFRHFHELRHLVLSNNSIVGSLESKEMSVLANVISLDLSYNRITGEIPASISNLSSLRVLNLESNELSGTLTDQVFSSLTKLRHLRLAVNKLNGSLPKSLCNHPNLRFFDLYGNDFFGEIPSQCFSNLTSLSEMYLDWNDFSGKFSFGLLLANNSRLQILTLSNNPELNIEVDYQAWVPPFKLKALSMSDCKLNTTILHSSAFLTSQYELEFLDLSNNNLSGNGINWLPKNWTKLAYLNMRNNSLAGDIQLPSDQFANMKILLLDRNSLKGSLPETIHLIFPNMLYINLVHNELSGKIPVSLMDGTVNLHYLVLSNNYFGGKFIGAKRVMTNLVSMRLDGNNLVGSLPNNFSLYPNLNILDLQKNRLSGQLPTSIGSLQSLVALVLGDNLFEGQIPHQVCNMSYLWLLDLSNNHFIGLLPHCSQPLPLLYLNIGSNALTGTMPYTFFKSQLIETLNARNNQISGDVSWIKDLRETRGLILSHNKFEGFFTTKLCELHNLHLLDLSHNNLSSSLPTCLYNMTFRTNGTYFLPFEIFYQMVVILGSEIVNFGLKDEKFIDYLDPDELQKIEFYTKGNYYGYHGVPLRLMIGIDLSFNSFSGEIPPELGQLTKLKSLDLSHNQLTGPIPDTFSNLTEIETLDLSHNKLTEQIPAQLTQMKSIAVFSIAYNKLSGCIPRLTNQFATFDVSSFIGNPNLHGPPLDMACYNSITNHSYEHADEEHQHHDFVLYSITAAAYIAGFWVCLFGLFLHEKGKKFRVGLMDPMVDLLYKRIALALPKLKVTFI